MHITYDLKIQFKDVSKGQKYLIKNIKIEENYQRRNETEKGFSNNDNQNIHVIKGIYKYFLYLTHQNQPIQNMKLENIVISSGFLSKFIIVLIQKKI